MPSYLSTGWWCAKASVRFAAATVSKVGSNDFLGSALDDPRTFDELAVAWSRFSNQPLTERMWLELDQAMHHRPVGYGWTSIINSSPLSIPIRPTAMN